MGIPILSLSVTLERIRCETLAAKANSIEQLNHRAIRSPGCEPMRQCLSHIRLNISKTREETDSMTKAQSCHVTPTLRGHIFRNMMLASRAYANIPNFQTLQTCLVPSVLGQGTCARVSLKWTFPLIPPFVLRANSAHRGFITRLLNELGNEHADYWSHLLMHPQSYTCHFY